MSRKPSTDLFDLIKSLTKAEKRFFKLFAARHAIGGKNKYVELFDAIDRQECYDERALLEHNRSLARIDLRSMKWYLHDLILRSLRDALRERSPLAQMQYQIDKAEILMYKGLHGQAAHLLARARETAIQRSYLLKLLDILFHESSLKVHAEETNSLERHLELYHEKIGTMAKLRDNMEYYHLFMQVHYFQMETIAPRNPEERERLEAIAHSPLLADDVQPATLFGEMTRLEVQTRCCQLMGDIEGELRHTLRKLAFFDANPDFREHRWYDYIFACSRMLWHYIYFQRYAEFEAALLRMKEMRKETVAERVELELHIYYAELLYLKRRTRFDEALALVPEIIAFMEKHQAGSEILWAIQFKVAFLTLSITLADLKSALRWLGEIVNDRYFTHYTHWVEMIKLLSLVIYYELDDHDGLESAARSFYRFLKKKEKPGEFDGLLLAFMRKLPGISDQGELRRTLQDLHDALVHLRDTPEGRMRLIQFDFITWLRSKITGQTFRQMQEELRGNCPANPRRDGEALE